MSLGGSGFLFEVVYLLTVLQGLFKTWKYVQNHFQAPVRTYPVTTGGIAVAVCSMFCKDGFELP